MFNGLLGTTWQWWRAEMAGASMRGANTQLREEVRRARLAEATIKYDSIAVVLAEGMMESSFKTAQAVIQEVVETREELLGPDHLDTVKVLWLSGQLILPLDHHDKMRVFDEAALRLERAGKHPDLELVIDYAAVAENAVRDLELDTALTWLERIARAVPTIYDNEGAASHFDLPWALATRLQNDFGISLRTEGEPNRDDAELLANALLSISASQLLEGAWWSLNGGWLETPERWQRIAEIARRMLAASPDDPFALTALAAAQRVAETPEAALTTVRRAKEARIKAGLPLSAANAAVTAMSHFMLGQEDDARKELDQLREIARVDGHDTLWNRNADRYLAAAEAMIDPQPTPEQELAGETRQRRLAEADAIMRRRAEFMTDDQRPPPAEGRFAAPSVEELQSAFESRREHLGADAVPTIEAQFELALARNMEVPHQDLALLRDAADRAERSGDISRSRLIQILTFASWAHQNSLDFEYATHANSRIAELIEGFVPTFDGELPWVWWCNPYPWGRIAGFLGEESFEAFARDCRESRGEALRAAVVLNFAMASIRTSADPSATPQFLQGAFFYATQGLKADPASGLCATGLAITQYRLARYPEALAAAEQAGALFTKAANGPHPVQLAVLAMTRFQLGGDGHTAAARAALADLRALMADPANAETWAKDKDAGALLREAEALIEGVPQPADGAEK